MTKVGKNLKERKRGTNQEDDIIFSVLFNIRYADIGVRGGGGGGGLGWGEKPVM